MNTTTTTATTTTYAEHMLERASHGDVRGYWAAVRAYERTTTGRGTFTRH